jgi:hypothetical protein
MQAGHLRDRVADCIIEGAGGDFAAMDVGDRNVQQRCGDRGSQHLVAVAEHDQNIRRKLGERIGEAGNADAGTTRHRLGAIVVQLEIDCRRDRKTVGLNCSPGLAEARHEMHAAGDNAEGNVIRLLQPRQDAPQQSVVGPRTGDDGDAAACGHADFRHGDASSIPCSMT